MRGLIASISIAFAATASAEDAKPADLFAPIYSVLQSPRCMNCHPAGNAPLQTDISRVHRMMVSRRMTELGMKCTGCHALQNPADEHQPPGAHGWSLPPKETPMVFQGRTAPQLCNQLKDPKQNGNKSLDQLKSHFHEEPLVNWGFSPGAGRSKPPLTHEQLLEAVEKWIKAGAPCPSEAP
ncbi:MAG: Isoquinoline 1-oxidoreductase subunit [Myxococcaceae bacterium]